jgi:hypothetical protein
VPGAVAVVVRGSPEHVPAAGQQFDVAHDDVGVAGQVAPGPVKAGASAVVRFVDADGHAASTSA